MLRHIQNGDTALMVAMMLKIKYIVGMLLDSGRADVNMANNVRNLIARNLAQHSLYLECFRTE